MKSLRYLTILLFLFSTSCATVEIPDFYAHITLPASGDGYARSTVSKKKKRIPAEQWKEMIKRGIILMPEDYKILKKITLKNCITNKCKQAVGTFDSLFLALDKGLQLSTGR